MNLTKGQTMDLTKEAGGTITTLRLGAGWDVAEGKSVDLDLMLVPKGSDKVCYFGNKEIPGAKLDKDDRTGASSAGGADENIHIDAAKLEKDEYAVVVTIYDAKQKGQFFKDVKSAFVEVEDTATKKTLARYEITENGGDNYALVAGKITKKDGALSFTADHQFSTEETVALCQRLGANVS